MKEELLQYLWHSLAFNTNNLRATNGAPVRIGTPGKLNLNQGPDFFDSRIVSENILLAGCVEIHVDKSGWYAHKHHLDPRYNNVVLHVFWQNDSEKPCIAENGQEILELDFSKYARREQLRLYETLVESKEAIPCANLAGGVSRFHKKRWLHSLGAERIVSRSQAINEAYPQFTGDWANLLWIKLAGAFGAKVNKQAFERLGARVPFKRVQQLAANHIELDALLFGAAGFLEDLVSEEPYVKELQENWQFLCNKFDIKAMNKNEFSYSRIRPMNFPELRIAQLSGLVRASGNLTDLLFAPDHLQKAMAELTLNPFWETHYRLEKSAKAVQKRLTKNFADLIFINVLSPVRLLYAKATGDHAQTYLWFEKLEELKPEQNKLVALFSEAGIKAENALESQAILTLEQNYCSKKRCLQCAIGRQIFKKGTCTK